MAEGYRITEVSDFRITEDGLSRSTEGFNEGEVSLSASGSVASVGSLTTHADASLSTQGSMLNAGVGVLFGVAAVNATGSVTALPLITQLASSALNAIGTTTSNGIRIRYGISALSSAGSLSSAALKILYGVVEGGSTEVFRITEAGDSRVLENSTDVRTSIQAEGNIIAATLIGDGDKTLFSSEPYYKDDGSWKEFLPYVKWNGAWTGNIKIYKHTNGAWKRSY